MQAVNFAQNQSILAKLLEKKVQEQLEYEQKKNYNSAEDCRRAAQQYRKSLLSEHFNMIQSKFRQEQNQLGRKYKSNLEQTSEKWSKFMKQTQLENKKCLKEIGQRHKSQVRQIKEYLEFELPLKVKQSYHLLNLRAMQQHCKKQKNFVGGKRKQKEINELFQKESLEWEINRQNKIQTFLKTIKYKHQGEKKQNLDRQRIKNQQYENQKRIQLQNIHHKYQTSLKQIKSQYERLKLSHLKQFKNKGGFYQPTFR